MVQTVTRGREQEIPLKHPRENGKPSIFNDQNFETFTWAAGLAEATEQITIFTTTHIPTVHPLTACSL